MSTALDTILHFLIDALSLIFDSAVLFLTHT